MARLWAQVFTPVFLVVGVGGLFLGSAGTPDASGNPGGNLGPITLQLSLSRHLLDVGTLAVLVAVGFVIGRRTGRRLAVAIGLVFTALGVVGLVVGSDTAATKGVLGFHFPIGDVVFDLIFGVLGVLAGLGTLAAHEAQTPGRRPG